MNTEIILSYLSDLERNNNREWYHLHKDHYRMACQEFEHLIQELILQISEVDTSIMHNNPKNLTFKIVRDTRFSKDKTPYNPSFRAHIGPKGKQPIPVGYYLSIRPGNKSFLGGGLFASMFPEATMMVRDHIVKHGEEFEEIISDSAFASCFSVDGAKLKKVPKGYCPDHPQAEYLKNKSWYLQYPVEDEIILNVNHFVDFAIQKFILVKPFNDFLNQSLKEFTMPKRK